MQQNHNKKDAVGHVLILYLYLYMSLRSWRHHSDRLHKPHNDALEKYAISKRSNKKLLMMILNNRDKCI